MAGVRSALHTRISKVDMLGPVSTATLGVESGTFNAQSYPHGSRFIAAVSVGVQTEGTLTWSITDCDTTGGTYAAFSGVQHGTYATTTSATDEITQFVSLEVNPARPHLKVLSVETVSVTTAVPVHAYILVIPPAAI